MALALGRDAGGDEDVTARLDAHVGALVRADPRPFDVARDAETEVATVAVRFGLPLAEGRVADPLERQLEPARVVTAVVARRATVLEREADIPGHLVRLDQVTASHLDRLEPQFPGDEADDPLHDEGAVRPAGAAVGRDHRRVGVDHLELDRVVTEPVRPGELRRGDEGDDEAIRCIGAGVVDEAVAQREDPSVAVDGDLDVVALAAFLVGGHQVLAPVLRPLDRPAEADRRVRHQDLLRVEEHDLGAEASAHVGRDHLHVELRQAEDPGQPILDGQRRLGRVPDTEPPGAAVVVGDHAPALERAAAAPLDPELLAQHAGGPGEGGVGVARALGQAAGTVAGHVCVHA